MVQAPPPAARTPSLQSLDSMNQGGQISMFPMPPSVSSLPERERSGSAGGSVGGNFRREMTGFVGGVGAEGDWTPVKPRASQGRFRENM